MRYTFRLLGLVSALAIAVSLPDGRAAAGPASAVVAEPQPSESPARGPSTPWIGMNVWGLAAASDVYTCGATSMPHEQSLDATFEHLRAAGVSVVRFWAFQSYATGPDGERNWAALDRVFAAAEARGVWLIPVLSNNWADCDYWPVSLYPNGGHRKDTGDWYRHGYRQPYDGYQSSYVTWIDEVVGRYGPRGRALAWEVANEPQSRSTSAGDRQAFEAFLGEAVARVRANDLVTPVSLGSMGTGQPGFDGPHYGALLTSLRIDLATAHDYDFPDDALPRSGCTSNCLRADFAAAAQAGTPLYIGESGIQGCDAYRSDRLFRKMEAALAAGARGYVFWSYREDAPLETCGFDIGPQSQLMQRLKGWSQARDAGVILSARTAAGCGPTGPAAPSRVITAARTVVSRSAAVRCAVPVRSVPTPRAPALRPGRTLR